MEKLLEDYKAGRISIKEVQKKLESLPYEDLGFAKIDTHRPLRKGFPETLFCKGKTTDQIISIIHTLLNEDNNILATKATKKIYNSVKKIFSDAIYNEKAKS
ncbi:MAG: 1-(5-phosphoribosyl)-5-amino-4-imidazole-carboxylate carboxylase, partial [Candidatus Lokiarchaeia archaeon]|nr:1-(5-phosphoribosyl)-5-amino-4-imidazole-carboxylate carboxylase [Candidatus Lokiarchaeia archaeon]